MGNSLEYYPKCIGCREKLDVVRRKRKALIESDMSKKKQESQFSLFRIYSSLLVY